MSRFALPFLLLTLLAGCTTTSPVPNLSEVEAVERARFQAFTKSDTAAMQSVLADDVVYCHSTGVCQGKQEFIAAIASKQTVYRRMQVIEMKPRAIGDAVLVNGKLEVDAEAGGTPITFKGPYTAVYVKRDGRWQLVSWQSTKLP